MSRRSVKKHREKSNARGLVAASAANGERFQWDERKFQLRPGTLHFITFDKFMRLLERERKHAGESSGRGRFAARRQMAVLWARCTVVL